MNTIENLRLERAKLQSLQDRKDENGETHYCAKRNAEIEGINHEIERLTCIEAVERAETVEFFNNPVLRDFYKKYR